MTLRRIYRTASNFIQSEATSSGFRQSLTTITPFSPSRSLAQRYRKASFFSSSSHFPTSSVGLPVLDALLKKASQIYSSPPLAKTAIYYTHHPLQTSVNLLKGMITLGAKPSNIFVVGKHYSECPAVVEEMKKLGVYYQPATAQTGLGRFSYSFTRDINWLWNRLVSIIGKDVENILILDHGGHALAFTPDCILNNYRVVGVEKTTAGLLHPSFESLPFPIIEVASCAIKRVLESPLIAEAVVTKLLPLIPIKGTQLTCGVIGYGAIGKAVTDKLLAMGNKVIVYDNQPNQLKDIKDAVPTNELPALVAFSDYIFSCTGRDVTTSIIDHFRLCPRDKTLISCSSEDIEFLTLLQNIQRKQNGKVANKPLSDISYQTDMGATIRILRGGFPVNFDNSGESVPANDIQLTRALVLGSVLQAVEYFRKPNLRAMFGGYMLEPELQQFIALEWLKHQPLGKYSSPILNAIQSDNHKEWLIARSGGRYEESNIFNQLEQRLKNAQVGHTEPHDQLLRSARPPSAD